MVFGRVLTAMVTPFTEDLQVDFEGARNLARYLADNGSDGIVVAGTTGESPTLSKEEKIKLFQVVYEEVGEKVKVIAGTGSNNTADTIALTKEAEKIGVDGIMVVVPYYNKPPQEAMYAHFKAIAEATSLPVMLYNVPGRTASNIMPATVARLAEIENIVAIKEASGNLDQVTEIKTLVGENLVIYSGDDSLTLPMLSVGSIGVVSVAAHVVGKDIQEMVQSYFAGEVKKASAIHQKIFPMYKGLFFTANPVPVKAALNMMGQKVGGVRLPLITVSDPELEPLKRLLQKFNLI